MTHSLLLQPSPPPKTPRTFAALHNKATFASSFRHVTSISSSPLSESPTSPTGQYSLPEEPEPDDSSETTLALDAVLDSRGQAVMPSEFGVMIDPLDPGPCSLRGRDRETQIEIAPWDEPVRSFLFCY